jgi:hypothetical protein
MTTALGSVKNSRLKVPQLGLVGELAQNGAPVPRRFLGIRLVYIGSAPPMRRGAGPKGGGDHDQRGHQL